VMTAAKEAMVKTAVEEVVAVTAAADTVAVERPNRFSGGGPDVVRTNTRGAPDMKPDPKAVGKRLSAMTWSGGSSPPPPPWKCFHGARWYATHLLQIFPFFFPLFTQVF
jgi:hypothetical protein